MCQRFRSSVDPSILARLSDTAGMRQRLSATQVAELAELLEDGPWRIGPVDEVLEAATEGRGMTLVLTDLPGRARRSRPGGPAVRRARAGAAASKSWQS
jgi:hypothetical protein